MDQHHMLHPQPSKDLARPETAMQQPADSARSAANAAVTQAYPQQRSLPHKPRDEFSAHLSTAPALQLPPLAVSFPDDGPPPALAPIQPPHEKPGRLSGQSLPPLSSVTGAQSHAPIPKPPEPSHPPPSQSHSRAINHWPSLNPFTTYYTPSYLESPSGMDCEGRAGRSAPTISLDDPDVRIAAEALGQMKTDCGYSPRSQSMSGVPAPGGLKVACGSPHNNAGKLEEQEPLLSLITTSHPLLATTIEGATSAYNSGKNYSPHLKSGAEYVESYLKPVGKAVGNVSRKTGVEGGVRWIFGRRSRKQRSSTDIETGERESSKRLKAGGDDMGQKASETPPRVSPSDGEDRRMSISTVDTLPAYDDQRSPAYTERAEDSAAWEQDPGAPGQPWGRFVATTSGLGVAMKQESLRSLKYCLKVLKDTNGYVSVVLVKLKSMIEEYDLAYQHEGGEGSAADSDNPSPHTITDRSQLIRRMGELREDIFRAIHRAVDTISKYAGSALPENARNIVHQQLMSLPTLYKFHYQRESEARRGNISPETGARDNAYLALLFAKEALKLMTQVGDVLNRTLISAEEWCDTLYRKRTERSGSAHNPPEPLPLSSTSPAGDQDVSMSG